MTVPRHFAALDAIKSVVIARFDGELRLIEANTGFQRLLPTESGSPPWTLITRPHLRELLKATPDDGGVVYRGRLTVGDPEGEMRTLVGSIYASDDGLTVVAGYDIDELERLPGLLLNLNNELDVTQRALVRANRETTRSEERFRIAARLASDIVWDWNLDTNRFWWDESIGPLLGYDTKTLPHGPQFWIDSIHPDDRARIHQAMQEVVRGERSDWSGEYRFPRADGTYALVESRAVVLRDDAGNAQRIIGSTRDITEQRKLEQRAQQVRHLEALARLTGGVAHEFNNLLTVILGNAEILAAASGDRHDLKTIADTTATAARRAAELTQHLLTFSRQQSLDVEAIDVGALTVKLVHQLRAHAESNIETILEMPDKLWPVATDPDQLEKVLDELCQNARTAMPEGGQLHLSVKDTEIDQDTPDMETHIPPGRYVKITVRDTGVGMNEHARRHAFDPFFTTKDVGSGVGLGLSMVYGFVTQANGYIDLQSSPGKGTSVNLYLPEATPTPPVPERDETRVGS